MKKFVLTSAIVLVSLLIQGQGKKSETGIIASVQPQFLLRNAMRIDVEVKPQNKLSNIIVSPELYSGYVNDTIEEENYKRDKLEGYGIGISHKIDFNSQKNRPYFSYGFMFRDLTISYDDEGFIPSIKDGLEYYEYNTYSDKIKINSLLLSTCIGIQAGITKALIVDFYLGLGHKTSSQKSTYANNRKYDQEQYSYAFNGLLPLVGLKLGYKIK